MPGDSEFVSEHVAAHVLTFNPPGEKRTTREESYYLAKINQLGSVMQLIGCWLLNS